MSEKKGIGKMEHCKIIAVGDNVCDKYLSRGKMYPGGQCVNTTDSAVRVTHIPTGIVVSCQDEKSQLKNKTKALKVLYARIYDMELKRHNEEIAGERKAQVGTGNRNERIRTYNFPQGRVTDHRVNLTIYKIDSVMEGNLEEIIDTLSAAERAEKLKAEE
mgnify:CR=1 FL=1